MSLVQLTYADAEALRVHQQNVRATNQQTMERIIKDRLSDQLTGKQREAGIAYLMKKYQPTLDQLDQVLDSLTKNVSIGMENFRVVDTQAGNKLQ